MDTLRLSVRGLVEFTIHGEDIRPSGSLKDRQEGQLGHRARQKLLGEDWETEVPLTLPCRLEEDLLLLVSGRMDAFLDGDVPIIEEIKLWQGYQAPAEPYVAHLAQAVCYGHMLCSERGLSQVMLRVTYVNRSGRKAANFDRLTTAEECRANFEELLDRYAARLKILRAHLRERNDTLRSLRFPYDSWREGQR